MVSRRVILSIMTVRDVGLTLTIGVVAGLIVEFALSLGIWWSIGIGTSAGLVALLLLERRSTTSSGQGSTQEKGQLGPDYLLPPDIEPLIREVETAVSHGVLYANIKAKTAVQILHDKLAYSQIPMQNMSALLYRMEKTLVTSSTTQPALHVTIREFVNELRNHIRFSAYEM